VKLPNVSLLSIGLLGGCSPKLLVELSAVSGMAPILLLSLDIIQERSPVILIFKHFFYKNYVGLSLWPFIILKEGSLLADGVLINHERIHLKQQRELLILPFYILYIVEWFLRTLYYRDSYRAYRNISFEREAYAHEGDMQYLSMRRSFAFFRYLTL